MLMVRKDSVNQLSLVLKTKLLIVPLSFFNLFFELTETVLSNLIPNIVALIMLLHNLIPPKLCNGTTQN